MNERLPFETFLQSSRAFAGFETLEKVLELQEKVLSAERWRLSLGLEPLFQCFERGHILPDEAGLSPVSVRQGRLNLLRLAYDRRIYNPTAAFVTARIAGWDIQPGDHSAFGRLRDNNVILALRQAFRNSGVANFLAIGAIEVCYPVVGNVPRPKPFHLHLMVKGFEHSHLFEFLKEHLPLDMRLPNPLRVDQLRPWDGSDREVTEEDFLYALSYDFKGPFGKYAREHDSAKPRRQWPHRAELAELMSNLGAHSVYGRLFSILPPHSGERFRPAPVRLVRP